MDQVVTVVRDHFPVGHHQDFDESLLRNGTTSPSPLTSSDVPADLLCCLIYKRKTDREK